LSRFREEIDSLDEQILTLLARRFEVVRGVAAHKRDEAIEMMQADRIQTVLDRTESLAESLEIPPGLARRLYREIIDETCAFEGELIQDGHVGDPDDGSEPPRSALARKGWNIDHVAIAVRDLEAAIATFRDRFGFEVSERRKIEGSHSGMISAVLRAGEIKFVLVQGTSPASNVSQYIKHYGPGVQHVALRIEDVKVVLDDLRGRGCDLLTDVIHSPGLDQMFTRRDSNSGMQIEFIARSATDDFSGSNVTELFEAMERENVY